MQRVPEAIAARSARSGLSILGEDGLFAEVLVTEGQPLLITDLRAPGGAPVLRPDLRADTPGDPAVSQDHPYQRGVRVAYADVDGQDLWTTNEGALVQSTTLDMPADGSAVVVARVDWRAPDGTLLCSETRSTAFAAFRDLRFVDVTLRFEATGDSVTFGDTKDGLMSLRLSDALAPSRAGNARAFDSEGRAGADIWGQEARWVAHTGIVEAEDGTPREVTVALLDHPGNRLSPCRWHVRPYGIVAANPFGLSAFDGLGNSRGAFTLAPYASLELRYRVAVAGMGLGPEELDALWDEFGGLERGDGGSPDEVPEENPEDAPGEDPISDTETTNTSPEPDSESSAR